jgi:hypothetical protein
MQFKGRWEHLYKIQVNREQIRNHFHYDKWKYVLGIVLVVFSWSMLANITAPRTPADKKVDIYLVGGFMLEEQAAEYADTVLADFPELMEVNIFNIGLEGDLEYAGRQKLMVMVGSQSGDIYSFTRDEFEGMAKLGAFLPLDDYPELLSYFTEEQLEKCTFTTEEDPTARIYGIPINDVDAIGKNFFVTEDSMMGVMAYSQNIEKSLEVLKWIIENKDTAQYEQKRQALLETSK